MTSYPKIWFLRNGQTEWNAEGRIQGRLNSDLTAQGRADARKQADLIAPFIAPVQAGPGGIFVSPQGRAQETARIALGGHEYQVDERIAEINTGEWEGRLRSELVYAETDIETYASAPGGEGIDGLETRVRDFLQSLTGPSILVSHGILGKVLRGQVLGLDRIGTASLCNRQGCVYVLEDGCEKILA